MRDHYAPQDDHIDLTIVGLGPAGLSACIEAAKLGLHVRALTKKQDYARGQRFKLYPHTMTFLDSLEDSLDPKDARFFEKMVQDDSIQTKDLEKFLRRKLERYSELVTIIELAEDNPITNIQHDSNDNITYLSLRDGARYAVTHLLGADGTKRTISRLVREGLGIPISYNDCITQDRYPYHAAVQLFKDPSKPPSEYSLHSEAEQGWDPLPFAEPEPLTLILANRMGFDRNPTKFSYTGEIPKLIFAATGAVQLELLKIWAVVQIAKQYKEPGLASQLDFRQSKKFEHSKDKLKATAFDMHLTVCNQAVFALPNGYYAPIGDARRTPNYKLAHGLHDAIVEGIEFVRCLHGRTMDIRRYEALITQIDQSLDQDSFLYLAPNYTENPSTAVSPTTTDEASSDEETGSFVKK